MRTLNRGGRPGGPKPGHNDANDEAGPSGSATPTRRQEILKVEGLTKVFRGRGGQEHQAVVDVGFTLAAGGSLAIVGESGSGKTTTSRIIAGLEVATAGSVRVDDQLVDVSRLGRGRRSARTVQMVFQDPFASLDPRQRVGAGLRELLRIHFDLSRVELENRVSALLEQVGLEDKQAGMLPRSLSGGQRQRVAIARALAVEPQILILDEAVSALDVSVQAQVLNLLADIRAASGVSYLFVSHDLGVVRQVTDSCVVMKGGRVVESGSTSDVLDRPQDPYTTALIDAVPKPGWQPQRRKD